MKMLSEIEINVKKRSLPGLIDELYKRDCEIHKIQPMEESENEYLYRMEVLYSDSKRFEEFITIISNAGEKYRVLSTSNVLQEKISGGLINIQGKLPLETISDYQTGVLGAYRLIIEKIGRENPRKNTGISRNVGIISGILRDEETDSDHLLRYYVENERDSVILSRFSGLNGFPLTVMYDHPEDIIKTLKRIEQNFSAIRLMNIDDANMMLYNQIFSELDIPVISRGLDEIPLYIMSILIKIMLKNKLKPGETTIGFIGIDISAVRLARILGKIGIYRVLGYDLNEDLMLSLENQGGLATTAENIFSNADITVLLKSNYEADEYRKIRPGQFILSLMKIEEMDMDVITEKGVREFIKADRNDVSLIFPGILRAVIDREIKMLDDVKLIDASKRLVNCLTDGYQLPDIFSDIHDRVIRIVSASAG